MLERLYRFRQERSNLEGTTRGLSANGEEIGQLPGVCLAAPQVFCNIRFMGPLTWVVQMVSIPSVEKKAAPLYPLLHNRYRDRDLELDGIIQIISLKTTS